MQLASNQQLIASVISDVKGLVALLAAFYIAALAAVSTFAGPGMDKVMLGDAPTIKRRDQKPEALTRRRFLSYLFGYLSLITVWYYVVLTFSIPVFDNMADFAIFGAVVHASALTVLFMSALVFGFMHIIVITMLGLHYLTDRIHRA